MLYALLAYHEETDVKAMTEVEDNALMDRLLAVHQRLDGQMGPAARLGATQLAAVVRGKGLVTDGPFAETKEAMLGFYVLDCADRAQAIAIAQQLNAANPNAIYEVRPIVTYVPGAAFPRTDAGLDLVRP
ncbi:MAG: YciI family protein [Alphaproteobacteria bacterium]|nr:YciI family protein [Alphaproteobacteria bacterium]MBU1513307.1 YciI family protein [Alphaproteobacteria bacterium]MBU2095926.1 YciI family protein [Alphaproteobacteria bacterium]MBU2152148.1 YciI family protein [Alphaproteobacteria bacterium]MBU2306196.1 YciI family protein [Alphaproteobacteria bacterium]